MKNFLTFIVFFIITLSSFAGSVDVVVQPKQLYVGDSGTYKIISDSDIVINRDDLPKINSIKWGMTGTSRSLRIINGYRTVENSTSIRFTPIKAGEILIPAFSVKIDGKKTKIPAQLISVTEDKRFNSVFLAEVYFNNQKEIPKSLNLGEEVELKIVQYLLNSPRLSTGFPTVEIEGALLKDYSEIHRKNGNKNQPKHFIYTADEVIRHGKRFIKYTFTTSITALKLEPIFGEIRCEATYKERVSFFDDGKTKLISKTIPIRDIQVKPIPELPENSDAIFLELLGKWNVTTALSKNKIQANHHFTITLNIEGRGYLGRLKIPELALKGFTLYKKEVKKNTDNDIKTARIDYIFIPNSEKSVLPKLTFATFNTVAGKYDFFEFSEKLEILPGKKIAMIPEDKIRLKSSVLNEDIYFIKVGKSYQIRYPLIQNLSTITLPLIVSMPLLYFFLLMILKKKETSQDEKEMIRKKILQSKKSILDKLHNADSAEAANIIQHEVLPFLAAAYHLPPGSTADELSEKIDDDELKKILQSSEESSFMPGMSGAIDIKLLVKKISTISMILYLSFAGFHAQAAEIVSQNNIINQEEQAEKAYENGQFKDAQKYYLTLLEKRNNDAYLLFNLGNCAYKLKNYGEAIGYFEKAKRIKPTDPEILENLNYARQQLGLKKIDTSSSPIQSFNLLRDSLRPDQWLRIGLIFWCLFWMIAMILRYRKKTHIINLFVFSCLFSCLIYFYFSQLSSTYREGQGIIIVDDADVYSLPNNAAKQNKQNVQIGTYIDILEIRKDSGFARVRTQNVQIWVKQTDLYKFW